MDEHSSEAFYLYDEIGRGRITAQNFADEFNAISTGQIDLHVDCPGGSVIEGVAIKNTIDKHPAKVVAHIDSMAGSIASAIVLACDEIYIADDAYVMIHNPSVKTNGDADELRKDAEILDKMTEGMAKEYAKRMDITVDAAKAIMDEETWYLGQEAVDAGFADSVYSGMSMTALARSAAGETSVARMKAIRRRRLAGGHFHTGGSTDKLAAKIKAGRRQKRLGIR